MGPKVILIAQPSIDLRPFVELVGQSVVNDIDSKRIQPVAKFAELVDDLLSDSVDPYAHLHATFYLEMPTELEYQFREYPFINAFRFTMNLSKMMSHGFMTASFDQWMAFIKWSSSETCSKYVRAYGNTMFRLLSHHSYFQKLKPSELFDKTFKLE